jgi:dipeptidyl aminopeptidase/acylaminoacyl peptidase
VILYTNPRDSTSFGEEFANLIHHAYPGHDFEDLDSGVDAILAKGYIDKDNLFVTGGSGGGVLTCWMIDHTDRFRAAASLYPVINWYSWVLTSDLPSFGAKDWFSGNPWDYTDDYMKRSVISLVKNVKTPTLLMTGEEDFRTPISEAEQYYAALKLLKIESVLVRFPANPMASAAAQATKSPRSSTRSTGSTSTVRSPDRSSRNFPRSHVSGVYSLLDPA